MYEGLSISELERHSIWSAAPKSGFFVRPNQIISFVATLVFGLFSSAYLLASGYTAFSILILGVTLAATIGVAVIDARLRENRYYVLTEGGLLIMRVAPRQILCVLRRAELTSCRLLWQSQTASIEINPGHLSNLEITPTWDLIIPSLAPCARLELIENAHEALETIRAYSLGKS